MIHLIWEEFEKTLPPDYVERLHTRQDDPLITHRKA